MGGSSRKKTDTISVVTQALIDTASQVSSAHLALSPTHGSLRSVPVSSPACTPNQSLGTSPAKLIESRWKCYKQLSELNNLTATSE